MIRTIFFSCKLLIWSFIVTDELTRWSTNLTPTAPTEPPIMEKPQDLVLESLDPDSSREDDLKNLLRGEREINPGEVGFKRNVFEKDKSKKDGSRKDNINNDSNNSVLDNNFSDYDNIRCKGRYGGVRLKALVLLFFVTILVGTRLEAEARSAGQLYFFINR